MRDHFVPGLREGVPFRTLLSMEWKSSPFLRYALQVSVESCCRKQTLTHCQEFFFPLLQLAGELQTAKVFVQRLGGLAVPL